MKLELRRRGLAVTEADNDVQNGIERMTSEMSIGNLFICSECENLIKEIENYVWDERKSIQGLDEPIKKGDHAVDGLRYAIYTHKVSTYEPYAHNPLDYMNNRFRSSFGA
jgi:phage terminase large subunit